ncbi:MAG TPA: mechanosensitive ion channel domain-containing protein [Casimicrobiaceae bacterium]|nr:mechanosensitive ion channel domain-containing protein [Casimicrobiaceae bacterium]
MEAPRLVQELDRFDVRLFTLGGTPITLWDIGFIVVGLIALFWFSGFLTRWLDRRLAGHTHLEETTRQTIGSLVRYTTLVIGFMIIMQAAGINLTTFTVVAGAIGVGVGFGLQNIVSNFVSGLIVMFERPVKIGDRVDVGGIEGSVVEIGARATTVLTNDNVAAIVPNQKLITETVKNWRHGHGIGQLRIVIAAKYANDLNAVRDAMLTVAAANPDVLRDPTPVVRLTTLSGGAVGFELRLHTSLGIPSHPDLLSALQFALMQELAGRKVALKE